MPSARAFSRAQAVAVRLGSRIARVAGWVFVAGFALFALTLLAVRFVAFPQIESHRDALTGLLSRQLGYPVEMAGIGTGWDGWNPRISIDHLRVLDKERGPVPLLELPAVDLIVAWTSLPLFELRLKQLVIERPRLAIRRDTAGMLHIAGIEIDPGHASDDATFTRWLLNQQDIVVRDALILWNDDLRNAPQLVLDRVQFRLENRYSRHRFGMTGMPPPELAAPIDVRGELKGHSIDNWQTATGQIYVRLDYADVAAWREWLPLPVAISRGKGALRLWFEFAAGEPREIIGDLVLADVRARLGDGLPELDLARLSGRAGWRLGPPQREFFAQQLAFDTADGQHLDATDFTLALRDAADGQPASGNVQFDRLQVEPLRSLAAHLPLPGAWRAELARYAPRGTLRRGRLQWSGPADAPTSYAASGEFDDIGLQERDDSPGFRGLGGSFDVTQAAGEVKLAGRNVVVALPRAFTVPIGLDSLQGGVTWKRSAGSADVRIEHLEFTSADAAGGVTGTVHVVDSGAIEANLDAQLARVDVRAIHKYLPRAANDATRQWLRRALAKGSAEDAKVHVAGDLAHFPFVEGKDGQFVVTAKARGVTLDYREGWAPLEDVDADFRMDGAHVAVDATQAKVAGTALGRVRADIANAVAQPARLVVEGTVVAPTANFLAFVAGSPVREWIDHATDGLEATGNGQLALRLEFPLGRPEGNRVAGEFVFADNQLRLPGVPTLTRAGGSIQFTERETRARDIAVEVLGGPAKLSLATVDGRARITGAGSANMTALRRDFPGAFVERVAGTADWNLAVDLRAGVASWVLDSNLKGVAIDLPAPIGKVAAEAVPLRAERRMGGATATAEDTLVVTYGKAATIALRRRLVGGEARIDRALLSLGRAAERPEAQRAERSGLWVRAEVPAVNLDDWLAVRRQERAGDVAGATDDLALEGVDLDAASLDIFAHRFVDLKVGARRGRDDWRIELRGRDVVGTATWAGPSATTPNGRLAARLVRFAAPVSSVPADAPSLTSGDARAEPAARWPELDIAADSFVSKGRDLGRLELVARPQGAEWRIDRLVLVNDAGRLDADGAWRANGRLQQTKLDVALDVKDAGAFLTRFGHPDALQHAPTKIQGQLAWAGAPNEFDYPSLAGTFRVETGAGRFTKIEPGIGKLLGVLSLQSLPRRITLDFADVFSEGFAFDSITGTVRVTNGVMMTDNLRLVGPAAQVTITGDADLARETQRLTVRVQPTLSAGVSAGAALLFIANPILGAAVGAGSLLAQKLLKDPIEQMFSYQYTVTGSWSDPLVARSGTATASAAPPPSAEPAGAR